MEKASELSKKIILKFGGSLGIISVIFGISLYLSGKHYNQHWIISVIGIAILFFFVFFGIKYYKGRNSKLNLSEALKIGIGVSLIGAVVSIIWTIFLMKVLEPNMVDEIIELSKDKMLKKEPSLTKEQIATSVEMMRKFTSPSINSAIIIITNLFLGLIFSLITGVFLKTEK